MKLSRSPLALLLAAALVACGKDDHHADQNEHDQGHTHEPLFGGALTELGDHEANLEVALNAETGELTMYLLDGHATDTVRSAQETLAVTIEPAGGTAYALTLGQVASPLSGEKVGDSSTYKIQDDRLKGVKDLDGKVASIAMLGTTYKDVAFAWPAGEHDHDH